MCVCTLLLVADVPDAVRQRPKLSNSLPPPPPFFSTAQVIGIDYSTQSYDSTHAQTPTIPLISSETSSAVSDRGEYASNAAAGHVDGYDDTAPGWGETAEGAWGGIGQSNAQGVFTRDFIAGGWTWTVRRVPLAGASGGMARAPRVLPLTHRLSRPSPRAHAHYRRRGTTAGEWTCLAPYPPSPLVLTSLAALYHRPPQRAHPVLVAGRELSLWQ